VLWVPLTGFGPLQAPDAAQAVALAEVQVNVAAAPLATVAGDASNVTDGTMLSATLAVELVPPGPVQSNE
jgi:hypothetical protein